MPKQYFATLKTDDLVKELGKKVNQFNHYVERTGLRKLWSRSADLYFGKHASEPTIRSTSVQRVGDKGELTAFGVNHYRNLIKHVLALTTSQKPAYDPRAKNSDLKSLTQAKLANNILDSYLVEKRMGRHMISAAERSLVFSKGFMYMPWEPSLGKQYDVQPVLDEEGQPMLDENGEPMEKIIYEGDVDPQAKSPFDVIYDPKIRDWAKNKWTIVRCWANRYDLATRYPKMADKILSLSSKDALDEYDFAQFTRYIDDEEDSDDMIPIYYFYHLKTDAVPGGRFTIFLNDEIALYDDVIPYRKKLPLFRITPGEVFDSPEGYAESFDVMVLQEVVNVLYSIPYTNQQAFGVQLVWLPDGCSVTASQVSKGLAFLKGGPPGTKPEALQLTQSPAEIFKNIQVVETAMEKLSGVNSVVRGDPEHNLKSGAALGRLQAMAIQFASNFQRSWAELQEDCGTFLLELLQDFANTERMVAIAGKRNAGAMVSFTGKDLDLIDRVVVDLGNPLKNTVSGRMDLADNLLEKGLIKNPQEYLTLISSGSLEPATEGAESENSLIRKENEALMDGKPVKAIVGDKHLLHAQEHRSVINDPYIREKAAAGDPDALTVVENTLKHIEEHKELHATQEPFWGMISGEPPAPQPPPPGPGPMGPPPGEGMLPPPPAGPPQQPAEAPPIPDMVEPQPPPIM